MIDEDPYLWLEDVTGEAALAWVRERTAETVDQVASDPGFARLQAELREVLDARDRIVYPCRLGPFLYSFWQDAEHVRGVWRRTTLEEYRTAEPVWDVLLDVDALAEAEGEPWVWAGAQVLYPEFRHALLTLSRDGADAVVVREFDLATRSFPADGFRLPEAKTSVAWIDRDHVFVGTDTGPGSLTASGYPRTVRRWRRGTALGEAELVHEVAASDLSTVAWRDHTEGFEREFVLRQRDFWHSELFEIAPDGRLLAIDVPQDAEVCVHRSWLLVTPKSPWLGHPEGTLLAFRYDAFTAGGREAVVLFAPDAHTALVGYAWTRNHLILEILDDVAARLEVLTPAPAGDWARETHADLPPLASATVVDTDPDTGDEYFLDVTGYLQPATLYRGEIGRGSEVVGRAVARFDTAGLSVRRRFAVSADGTRVPYFVIGPAGSDGSGTGPGPALLTGYGGFETSLTPYYSALRGRAWLARGGTYVVANIRGGGEYGPRWHRSALGADRVRSFEDFAAVAEDLVRRGVTTADRLGIEGGSNGGLLMGAMLTRYPHLFGAVVANVPLLDMLRFHRLLAGASWVAEYGDPDDPADRPHLADISPYHRLRAGPRYPPVLLTTSTRDDRVHPGHARKAAARLRELGHRVYFHEQTGGGHSGAADHEQIAFHQALVHTFLRHHLTKGTDMSDTDDAEDTGGADTGGTGGSGTGGAERAGTAAELFDGIGAAYEEAFAGLPGQLEALEWMTARLAPGARVLDVGSGTGRPVAEVLVRAGCEVTGIDVSSTMVDLARSQVPGARFEQCDVREFAPPAGSFDAVCAFFPLLLMSRADIDAALAAFASWLAPGGLFVMATVPADVEDQEVEWMGRRVSVSSYSTEEYLRRLAANGLEVLHSSTSTFVPESAVAGPEDHLFCYARRPEAG